MYIITTQHMFHFFEGPMDYTLSDFASSFGTASVPMALTSCMLEFVQGTNLDYDGAYELESIEKSKPSHHVHITF